MLRLPGRRLLNPYGDRAEAIAVLYEGARFDWMVPAYVPENAVASVEDLTKPDVLARIEHRIQGTGRDSGNMMLSAEVVKAYGLDTAGYELVPGTLKEFHAAYDRALAQGKWFIMPLWTPHYINRVGVCHRGTAGLLGRQQRHAGRQQEWIDRRRRAPRVLDGCSREAVAEMDYWSTSTASAARAAACRRQRCARDSWFSGQ
jgi:ABC-type proline/glycine betaine transport system substrate-binding protein